MTIKYLDLKKVTERHAEEIHEAVARVIDSGWYLQGEAVARFEEEYARYCGVRHCIACGNGLDALTLILRAYMEMGVMTEGDEVIVPANTYIASILSITENGLIPVLIEPRPDTFQIDDALIEQAITERTRAVMIVHLYGRMAYTERIGDICRRHRLKLVEDCAQSHGLCPPKSPQGGDESYRLSQTNIQTSLPHSHTIPPLGGTEGGSDFDFASLLRMVARAVPGMRVRFTTSHPKDMSDETLRVIAEEPNVCRHIHLPVQSGSNRILKLMNRRYTREWYLDRVAAIRRIVPDCAITTDIFVGYHSETEEDHRLSLSLMREVGYDSAFMFKYSERPGTYASKHLPDDVPEDVKIRRLNEMIQLQTELSAEANRRDVGHEFDVLVEGYSKRSREQMCGRTEQNKMVVFDKGQCHVGQTVRVKITDSTSATLFGEVIK